VATLGLHQLAFILRSIRQDGITATLNWVETIARNRGVSIAVSAIA
jgi:hypothetical protein